ncbi:hypothetical protein [Roseomonas chloroacetimidivorans]|uniref:hypothetical protein n=1 Tax=Roseomonas chloroacetimidivorans TaxID=1766656 RepID=UPI003C7792E5
MADTQLRYDVLPENVLPADLTQADADRRQAARDAHADRISQAWKSPDQAVPALPSTPAEAHEQRNARLSNAWKDGR